MITGNKYLAVLTYDSTGHLTILDHLAFESHLTLTDIALCGSRIAVAASNNSDPSTGKVFLYKTYHTVRGLVQLQEITGRLYIE